MNAADRQTIRAAINVAARERVDQAIIAHPCAGCGCHPNQRTRGCRTCYGRHRARELRAL